MLKLSSLPAFIFMLFSLTSQAQVTVNSTGGTSPVDYVTLKDAFDAVNAGSHTGTIDITIVANTTEAATASLNGSGTASSSYTSLTVKPSGGAFTIYGSIAIPLVLLNGADNVTIDGLNDGTNTLTIENGSISALASTIRLGGDAQTNMVTNCTIKGSSRGTTTGTLSFISGDGTGTGNDNNTIRNNRITHSGVNVPYIAIYSSASPIDNSSNTIIGNAIDNWFGPSTSAGIFINSGNSAWTITNNKLSQSGTRTLSGTHTAYGIRIANTGGGYLVKNNVIGFADSTGAGKTTYSTGAFNINYRGIDINVSTSSLTQVDGNTIAGITVTGTGTNSTFTGINVIAGQVSVTNNTVGATTGTGSISYSSSGAVFNGIAAASTTTVTITGNSVGSISLPAIGATNNFYGINAASSGTYTINNNTIGSTTTAGSITVGTDGVSGSSTTNVYGIYGSLTGSVSVGAVGAGNTIQNIALYTTGLGTMAGILTASFPSSVTINYNTVANLSSGWSSSNNTVTIGFIYTQGGPASLNISNNNISNNAVLRTAGSISGIRNSSTTNGYTYNNNVIANITRLSSLSGSFMGIQSPNSASGVVTFSNNSITGLTSGDAVYGIYGPNGTGTVSYTNNTISSVTAGLNTSQAIYAAGGGTLTISGNTISNYSSRQWLNGIVAGASTSNVFSNTINGLSAGPGTTAFVAAIVMSTSGVSNCYKNKIYDLSTSSADGICYGMRITNGTTVNVYNNYIGDLRAPLALSVAPSPSVMGIYISNTANVWYNTIYLDASSTAADFGTAAVYVMTYAAAIELRNNIFVNKSTPKGTGLTVVHQRDANDLTNYASTSDRNDLYAGSPDAAHLLFYDGTNAIQDLASFKLLVTPADQNSVSVDPTFTSTTGSNINYLHISTASPTSLDGGGTAVTGITDDYDVNVRNATTPDIGADEFTVAGILPVELISFTGKKETGRNLLDWTTATEINNKGFEVQRSTNGVAYANIGFVKTAALNGNYSGILNYHFNDSIITSAKQYYRLKQIDIDGRFKYSSVIVLENKEAAEFTIYPNPASDHVFLRFTQPNNANVQVIIADMNGRVVSRREQNAVQGINIIRLDLKGMVAGSYVVKIISEGVEAGTVIRVIR